MKRNRMPLVGKVILLQFAFLVLHFLYEWLPGSVSAILSSTTESVYQHMKAAFFAYLFVSLLEYAIYWKRIEKHSTYLHTRALTAVLFSLLVLTWYYTSCAYFVKFDNLFLEVLFANLATILTSITGLLLEQHLEKVAFSRGLQWVSLTAFLVTLSEFIIFTFRLPWLDVFARPAGW